MSTRSEIETRLSSWAKAQTPPIPVAFENVLFTKPKTGPYIEVMLLGETKINRDVRASEIRTYGMFQINCYAPPNGGMAIAESLAQSVTDLYPVLPKTGTVSIEAPLNTSGSYVSDGYVCVPVRGRYRVET